MNKWIIYNPFHKQVEDDTLAGTRSLAIRRAVDKSPVGISKAWKSAYRRGFRAIRVKVTIRKKS